MTISHVICFHTHSGSVLFPASSPGSSRPPTQTPGNSSLTFGPPKPVCPSWPFRDPTAAQAPAVQHSSIIQKCNLSIGKIYTDRNAVEASAVMRRRSSRCSLEGRVRNLARKCMRPWRLGSTLQQRQEVSWSRDTYSRPNLPCSKRVADQAVAIKIPAATRAENVETPRVPTQRSALPDDFCLLE